jgi:hypothetical protein
MPRIIGPSRSQKTIPRIQNTIWDSFNGLTGYVNRYLGAWWIVFPERSGLLEAVGKRPDTGLPKL